MSERIRLYVAVTVGASLASAVAVFVLAGAGGLDDISAAGFFAMLVLLAQLLRYEGSKSGATGSVAFLPMLASLVVAPVLVTPLFCALGVAIAEIVAKRPSIRVSFNVSQYVLATSLAIIATRPFAPLGQSPPTIVSVLGLLVCAFVFHGVNTTTVAGAISIDSSKPFSEVWFRGTLRTVSYDLLAIPVVYILAWAYHEYGVAPVLLFVLPLFGLRQLYKQNWEVERSNEELLQVLVTAFEMRDPYTSGHSQRVSKYAVQIGRAMKIGTHELEHLRVAALLHDVGKIHEGFAPVLGKAGWLTDAERRLMEMHPILSERLAAGASRLKRTLPAIRSHHERWDGRGYPDRLVGENIPRLARIVSVADTVDAMTSSRPYRVALDIEAVRVELTSCRGTQFDPEICDTLLGQETWIGFARLVEALRPDAAVAGVNEKLQLVPSVARQRNSPALSTA